MAVCSDFKNENGIWQHQRNGYYTKSGSIWHDMNSRCRDEGYYQRTRPSYIGCYVSDYFKDFQKFVEWHASQVGYECTGYELDKDLLYSGNKIYSPETCVLIPQELNKFLVAPKNKENGLPNGVTWHVSNKKFQATVREKTKKMHLGYFSNVNDAYLAYRTAKEQIARNWYNRLSCGEFLVDYRVIERMKNWKFEESEVRY